MASVAFDLSYDADQSGVPADVSGEAEAPSPFFSVSLPIPTSTNAMYSKPKKGKVHRSREYNDWRHEVSWRIQVAKKRLCLRSPIKKCMGAIIEIDRPTRKRDLDNCLKTLFDALETGKVIENDNLISFIMVCWSPSRPREHWARIHLYDALNCPVATFVGRKTGVGVAGQWMIN